MVDSWQVEIRYHSSIGWQRGRGFDAFAPSFGRTKIPFSRNYVVPAAKSMIADLLDFAVPEIADVFGDSKKRRRQRAWEDKLWENSWVIVAENGKHPLNADGGGKEP